MTAPDIQLDLLLPPAPDLGKQVREIVLAILSKPVQPSARELLAGIESALGVKARWDARKAIEALLTEPGISRSIRAYLGSVLESGDLDDALRGEGAPDTEFVSSIDSLLQQSRDYRDSEKFREMIQFMGKFREYAPFNNMLVRLQNPACSFFATETIWRKKFRRTLKEDARPMLILQPMRPVMLVYDLDQTEGGPLPEELDRFASFEGHWNESWLSTTVENAAQRDRIRVDFKTLSSTLAGFATFAHGDAHSKRRIAIHDQLDGPSRFGVLCHELAHIYLGHLGSDSDHWWLSRCNLGRNAIEVEAEAVAFLVTLHLGLQGSSSAYVSRHMRDGKVPEGVSRELIAKVAGRIGQMAREKMPRRVRRVTGRKAA
ncbi:MAG: hypothetical protein HY017_13230 [Betaproteobacteria bacterium]|nr:hypothetical protein [Betaproteobacteria bacterium]